TIRDHAFRDVAKSQAKAGDIAGAKATVGSIKDMKDQALREIAEAQANAGDFSGAVVTARAIGSDYYQADALGAIALLQAKDGHLTGAEATLRAARSFHDLSLFRMELLKQGSKEANEYLLNKLIEVVNGSPPPLDEDNYGLFISLHLDLAEARIRFADV